MLCLQSARLLLFALTREQLDLALKDAALLAENLHVHVDPEVFSVESRSAMLIKMARMEHVDPDLHPWYTYFLLVERAGRRAVGVCGFKGAPTAFGAVEVGYAMYEPFRNQGYMTETVRALIDWAFTQPICCRVTAETLRDNFPSQRVLQKAGMTLERESQHMLYWKIDKDPEHECKGGEGNR